MKTNAKKTKTAIPAAQFEELLWTNRHKENVAALLVETGIAAVREELIYVETKKAA